MALNTIQPVMDFEKYDIGKHGFLTHVKVNEFPQNLDLLNTFLKNMHSISNFQNYVDSITLLYRGKINYDEIENYDLEILKFIYSACGIMVSKYIWCTGENYPNQSVPKILGYPHVIAAKKIGIVPVLTHTTVDLLNYTFVKEGEPFDYEPTEEEKILSKCVICLDNLMVKHSMTNTKDEHWFYLIMIRIEHYGLNVLNAINNANQLMTNKSGDDKADIDNMYNEIEQIVNCLKKMTTIVKKMYENCDPETFFYENRVFLNGYKTKKFPNGLKIDGTDIVLDDYDGGSAAQSSLIQCIDSFLHKKTIGCKYSIDYLKKMRDYMPIKHKNAIEHIENYAQLYNIYDYVNNSNSEKLICIYNEAIQNLTRFRQAHYGLVKSYVFKFTGETSKGTGGTSPKVFLNDLITNTIKSQVVRETQNISAVVEFLKIITSMCILFMSLFIIIGLMFAMAVEHTLLCSLSIYLVIVSCMLWLWIC